MKNYKITIKPYLNKRVKAFEEKIVTDSYTNKTESHKGWPLYYQVIYKRKNTNLRSHIVRNRGSMHNYFSDEGFFHNPDIMQKVINKEAQVIDDIIRHKESIDKDFSLDKFASTYHLFSDGLLNTLNSKLKARILVNLTFLLDQDIKYLFNFKKGTYYSIYKYSDILFPDLNLFTKYEIQLFEDVKLVFDYYCTTRNKGQNKLKYHFNVSNNQKDIPLVIDFYNNEFPSEINKLGIDKLKRDKLRSAINEILKY